MALAASGCAVAVPLPLPFPAQGSASAARPTAVGTQAGPTQAPTQVNASPGISLSPMPTDQPSSPAPAGQAPDEATVTAILADYDQRYAAAAKSPAKADWASVNGGLMLAEVKTKAAAAAAKAKRAGKSVKAWAAKTSKLMHVYGYSFDGTRETLLIAEEYGTSSESWSYATVLVKDGGTWRKWATAYVPWAKVPSPAPSVQQIESTVPTGQALVTYRTKGTKPKKATIVKPFVNYWKVLNTSSASMARHFTMKRSCKLSASGSSQGMWQANTSTGVIGVAVPVCVDTASTPYSNYWMTFNDAQSSAYGYTNKRLRYHQGSMAFPTAIVTASGKTSWYNVDWWFTSKAKYTRR